MNILKNRMMIPATAFLTAWLLASFSCNPKARNFDGEIPNQPVGIKVRANSGLTFTLYYYVQNQETSFDGYNVYITRESTGNTQPANLYPPYSLRGSSPTLVHNQSDIDVDQPRIFFIPSFVTFHPNSYGAQNTLYLPFQAGVRYFFKITAHTIFDKESLPSNEVSAVAIP